MPGRDLFETAPQLLFGRFQVLQELGVGSQGRVVRAFDTLARAEVALKILRPHGSGGLERFKAEFRTLAGLVHPNLVRLGELFERDQVWGFSMELVRGGDFLHWVRPDDSGFSEERLRAGLAQTVSALAALHRARVIHRDIKPENLRVTREGRVVIVDFGLAAELGPSARTASQLLVGTVGYIAPELINGELATDRSDLYALGAVLYQALTGGLPYEGTLFQIATLQRAGQPARPSSLCPSVAPDLDELCMALLAHEPEKRPSTEQAWARLSAESGSWANPIVDSSPDIFFGRDSELQTLKSKLLARERLGMRSLVVRGESGIGKSALVTTFVRWVRREMPGCVVLSGRCHPCEHVSYNAFDDVFCELSRLLSRLDTQDRRALLAPNAALLPTLSPYFAQVPGILESGGEVTSSVDRVHLFDAFLDLLSRLSASLSVPRAQARKATSLLITVDDVQWADNDSMQLLRSMLERQKELDLYLIATSRCELREDAIPSLVHELLADPRLDSLLLAPLDESAARSLGMSLLDGSQTGAALQALLDEAGGSPLFLIELARSCPTPREPTTLESALRARVASLPAGARAALETLALASAPLSSGVLIAALGISIEELYGHLTLLRRERLVCETPSGELMTYHDRVRQAVAAAVDQERLVHVHAALALGFELPSFVNPLRAAQHWLLAGDEARAAPRLEEAAERAFENAVFEQAAELYRQRLQLVQQPVTGSEQRALQVKLADALAATGRCSDSARVLLDALAGASAEERRDLSLRAAQQLLQAGEVAAGMEAAALALHEVGLPWRASAAAALLHLGVQRLQIRASHNSFMEARSLDVALTERQLDTMLHLTHPLAWSDILRSMEISARGLLLAMRERRSDYLPLLLAAEAVQATMRDPGSAQGPRLLAEASSWLHRDSAGRERAYCTWAAGATTLLQTKYAEADKLLREAERLYRVECPGEAWMHVNARGMLLNAWLGLGEHREFVAQAELWSREAQAKGNAYAEAYYSVGGQGAFRHAVSDTPVDALNEIERVIEPWQTSWGLHGLLRIKAVHDVLSYMGDDRAYLWWQQGVRVPPLTPAFFAEGFAWRKADATLRAGITRHSQTLVRKAARMVRPLAHAVSPYVRVFGGLTAMQIALIERRKADGRRIAASIREDVQTQDDFRMAIYEPLLCALSAPGSSHAALWAPIAAWFEERGWKNPERALAWILPIAALK